jgi:hypothetical protein
MGSVNVGVTTQIQSATFFPCIKCGSEDVKFRDCGYNTYNPYLATCKCGHEVKEMDTSIRSIVEKWNAHNDPAMLLESINSKMETLKAEAKRLKKIIATRKRKEAQDV